MICTTLEQCSSYIVDNDWLEERPSKEYIKDFIKKDSKLAEYFDESAPIDIIIQNVLDEYDFEIEALNMEEE